MAKKSQAKMYRYRKEDQELFKDVVFMVQCTYHEQFTFWQDYYDNPKYENCCIEDWDQEGMGQGITIGELDGRPICITIFWEYLEGYRVMFYEVHSQVVDHVLVDRWINHFGKDIKYDNGYRWAHCNSSNFHHCVHAIQDLVKKKGIGPGNPRGRRNRRDLRTKDRKILDAAKRGIVQIDDKTRKLIDIARNCSTISEAYTAAMQVCRNIDHLLKQ